MPFSNTIFNQDGYTLVDTSDNILYLNPGFELVTMPTNFVVSSIDMKQYHNYAQVYVDNGYQYIDNSNGTAMLGTDVTLTGNLSTKMLLFYKGRLVRTLPY